MLRSNFSSQIINSKFLPPHVSATHSRVQFWTSEIVLCFKMPNQSTLFPPFISAYANFNRIKTKDKPLKANTPNSALSSSLGTRLRYGPSASDGIMASISNQNLQSTSHNPRSWINTAVYCCGIRNPRRKDYRSEGQSSLTPRMGSCWNQYTYFQLYDSALSAWSLILELR